MQKPPDEVFIQLFTFTPRRLATDHLDVPTDVSRLRPDGKLSMLSEDYTCLFRQCDGVPVNVMKGPAARYE